MDKGSMKAADESIRSDQKLLRKGDLTKRRRAQVQRKNEFHHELLFCTQLELEKKLPDFSDAISKIEGHQVESVLCDLAGIHEALANVPRFEHA
jgi:hypothetical protein